MGYDMQKTVLAALAAVAMCGPAWAQDPANGDFESGDLAGWTPGTTAAAAVSVVDETTAGFSFPSADHAVHMDVPAGSALADSDSFLLLGTQLSGFYRTNGLSAGGIHLRNQANDSTLETTGVLAASSSSFGASQIDVSDHCGDQVRVRIEAGGLGSEVWYDDIEVGGSACPGVDKDGDGYCPAGQDLNENGHCYDNETETEGTGDCDDTDADEFPGQTWYPNCDGDSGYASMGIQACSEEDAEAAFDCDDGNPPGDWSLTAGTDCNDEDATGVTATDWYPDCDGDGVYTDQAVSACGESGADDAYECPQGGDPDTWSDSAGTDCDDEDDSVSSISDFYPDCDNDGEASSAAFSACGEDDADARFDCDDGDPPSSWYTSAGSDCDDEDETGQAEESWYPDCDDDGEHTDQAVDACGETGADAAYDCDGGGDPADWDTTAGTDCNDNDGSLKALDDFYPDCDGDDHTADVQVTACGESGANAAYDCPQGGDPVSWEGSGESDCDDTDPSGHQAENWYPDCDGDEVYTDQATNACGTSGADAAYDCPQGGDPDSWSTSSGDDCNDEDVDYSAVTKWYPDCDDDGVHDGTHTEGCGPAGADAAFDCQDGEDPDGGWSDTKGDDCNDEDPTGSTDEDWYPDCDGDAVYTSEKTTACGTEDADSKYDCPQGGDPDGWSLTPGDDCDDEDVDVFEDEDWYPDCDGDTYFADSSPTTACGPDAADDAFDCQDSEDPDGGWDNQPGGDCNDEDANVFPDQTWYADCDGDGLYSTESTLTCDFQDIVSPCEDAQAPDGGYDSTEGTDCDDEDVLVGTDLDWYPDCDGDGVYADLGLTQCPQPAAICAGNVEPVGGWSNDQGADCDDEDVLEQPGQTWFADCDDDGFFAPDAVESCEEPATACDDSQSPDGGWDTEAPTEADEDCDDENDTINPDGTEIPGNNVDEDCDGTVEPGTDTGLTTDTGVTDTGLTTDTGFADTSVFDSDVPGTDLLQETGIPDTGALDTDGTDTALPVDTGSDSGGLLDTADSGLFPVDTDLATDLVLDTAGLGDTGEADTDTDSDTDTDRTPEEGGEVDPDGVDNQKGGCQCSQGGVRGSWAFVFGFLALVLRRRD